MNPNRVGSSVLLAGGVVLVFAGLTSALGYSTAGVVASAAAIVALLYAGAVWFGGAPRTDTSVILFTPQLTVAAGPLTGRAMADLFPAASRKEIESRCRAALTGAPQRFTGSGGETFEAAPIRGADGAIVYGILISGAATTARAAAG